MPTVQAVEARAQQAEISHRMQQPDQAISSPDLLEYNSSVRATQAAITQRCARPVVNLRMRAHSRDAEQRSIARPALLLRNQSTVGLVCSCSVSSAGR
jgi:hypothetical protein